jgi:type II secretory pathway component PulK
MNVVKIFFASLVVAVMVAGCSSTQDSNADAAREAQQAREAQESARQAEEAAKRAETAAEKAEVIFHKSLEK